MLFATPDFGASGIIVLFLLVGWVVLLGLVVRRHFSGNKIVAK